MAKWDHYVDQKLKQLELTTKWMDWYRKEAEEHDRLVTERMNYMYTYYDYRHDRQKARARFLKHANRKSTLGDIGALLDKWTLDSKAQTEHFHGEQHLLE